MPSTRLLTIAALTVASGVAALWWRSGPDASQFAHLREPRLTRLGDQRMLVVEAAGDPNVVGNWLLGPVVERASGETSMTYVSEHIIRPLAIAPQELGYVVADPAHHATGYLEKYSLMNLAKGFLIDRDLIGNYSGRWLEIRSH